MSTTGDRRVVTKLRPPVTGAVVLPSAAVRAFRRERGRSVVLVVAGPGWGKSTSAALALPGAAWCVTDARDRDPTELVGGLAAALGGDPALASRSDDPMTLATVLRTDVVGSEDRWLVVDDVDHVVGTPGFDLLVELGRRTDGGLRLVLVGRHDLAVNGPGHFHDAGVIRAPHLALDDDTVAALLGDAGGDALTARRLVEASGGWPRLCREVLGALPHADAGGSDGLTGLLRADGPAGALLADEVVPATPPLLLGRLTQLALFGTTSGTELAEATGSTPAAVGAELSLLVTLGLARRRAGSAGGFEALPVVEGFLIDQQLPGCDAGPEVVADLVQGLVAAGRADLALRTATRADLDDTVPHLRAVLEGHGDDLLREAQVGLVEQAAARIPTEHRDVTVERLHGQALQMLGHWTEALACYRAMGASDSGPLSSELAIRIGLVHHFRGELTEALEVYDRGPSADDGSLEFGALASWRATAHWLRNDLDRARHHADVAMRVAVERDDDRTLSLAHTVLALLAASDGDRRGNDRHQRLALAAAQRCGDVLNQVRLAVNRGSHFLEQGQYERALAETDRAIELGGKVDLVPMLAVAHCNRAEVLIRTGALDLAVADAEAAIELFERLGSRNASYALRLLGDVRRERGDGVLARQAYERAIELSRPHGDLQGVVPALAGCAQVAPRSWSRAIQSTPARWPTRRYASPTPCTPSRPPSRPRGSRWSATTR